MKVKYIGNKPAKEDNVQHSGVVWYGNGDVREVPDAKAIILVQQHSTVWEAVAEEDDGDPHKKKLEVKRINQQRLSEDDSQLDGARTYSAMDVDAAKALTGKLDANDKLMMDWAEKEGITIPPEANLRGQALEDFLTNAIEVRGDLMTQEARRLGAQSDVAGAGTPDQIKANKDAHEQAVSLIHDGVDDPEQMKTNEAIRQEETQVEKDLQKAHEEQAKADRPEPKTPEASTKVQAAAHKTAPKRK
jgi:hypothetical protein